MHSQHPPAADYQPQAGDLVTRLEGGLLVCIPPERQLTQWRGPNPYESRRRQPLGLKELGRMSMNTKAPGRKAA